MENLLENINYDCTNKDFYSCINENNDKKAIFDIINTTVNEDIMNIIQTDKYINNLYKKFINTNYENDINSFFLKINKCNDIADVFNYIYILNIITDIDIFYSIYVDNDINCNNNYKNILYIRPIGDINILTEDYITDYIELKNYDIDPKKVMYISKLLDVLIKNTEINIRDIDDRIDNSKIYNKNNSYVTNCKLFAFLKTIDGDYNICLINKKYFDFFIKIFDNNILSEIKEYIKFIIIHNLSFLLDETHTKCQDSYNVEYINNYNAFIDIFIKDIELIYMYKFINITKYHNYKNVITTMFNEIKIELLDTITNNDAYDNVTRKFIIDKINNITLIIGISDIKILNIIYHLLNVNIDKEKNLVFARIKNKNILQWATLNTTVDISEYKLFDANAFNNLSKNTIIIPLAIINEHLINFNNVNIKENVFNYTHLGFILAHEIMHALDTLGIKFDKYGKYNPSHKQIKYIHSDYNLYLLYMTKMSLYKYTLNENFSDFEAMKICINIIKKKNNNINNINDILKLYFINYAYFWRTNYNNDTNITHNKPKERTNFILSLIKDFCIIFNYTTNFEDNEYMKIKFIL